MPLYDFVCVNDHTIELLCSSEINEKKCPVCGEITTRQSVSRVSAVFKGTGTSKTDNASIDIKVGRDSKLRWERYYNKFKSKETLKLKNPDANIISVGEGYAAVESNKVKDVTENLG